MFLAGHDFNILVHKYFSKEREQIKQFSFKSKLTALRVKCLINIQLAVINFS